MKEAVFSKRLFEVCFELWRSYHFQGALMLSIFICTQWLSIALIRIIMWDVNVGLLIGLVRLVLLSYKMDSYSSYEKGQFLSIYLSLLFWTVKFQGSKF